MCSFFSFSAFVPQKNFSLFFGGYIFDRSKPNPNVKHESPLTRAKRRAIANKTNGKQLTSHNKFEDYSGDFSPPSSLSMQFILFPYFAIPRLAASTRFSH